VLAVLRPGSLVEQWRALRLCQAAGVIIMQAANTGLTGGSTPDGNDNDRPIVIINAMRIAGAEQVVALPGVTLFQLEKALRPLGREPHSVIGSCIGASVTGGIANNCGGALIRRGPAFTQLALYARVNEQGEVELINHLGIRLGNEPEAVLARLEAISPPPRSSIRETAPPRIPTTSPMCATFPPPPRRASMPTHAACSRPRAAPAR
jgi:D-lactate dehydrogenase (quinone)